MITTTRRIAAIAGATALAVMLIWYFALLRPQTHDVAAAHKAQRAAEQQITQLDSQVSSLEALVKQIPADTARLKAVDAALPDTPSLDTALTALHRAAAATGVALTSVSPSTPSGASGASGSSSSAGRSAPGGPAITLTLNASGSYPQLMSFFRSLASAPRTFVVDSLSLSGGKVLTASVGARVFYAGSPTP
jgi:Tfp pilus assembly protein PilO